MEPVLGREKRVLDRVNRARVTGDLLSDVLRVYSNMPPDDCRVFEARYFELLRFLDEKGLGEGKGRADIASAIEFRFEALAKMEADRNLRPWITPSGEQGCDFVHADLLKAAAEEPIIEDAQGGYAFNPDSFRLRVLAKSKPYGSA